MFYFKFAYYNFIGKIINAIYLKKSTKQVLVKKTTRGSLATTQHKTRISLKKIGQG